ncbi:MAG: isocitrate/isopropylmalate dehydrogenase family protein [Candidatus Korobacteraceae bacterium]|jgi:3-isopropylmalate dehydrogenase
MDVLILPGDGIGPETIAATMQVLNAVNGKYSLGLNFPSEEIGLTALKKTGTTMPPHIVERARKAHGVLLGPVSHNEYPPRDQGGRNPSGDLRIGLDLYANIRPSRSRPGTGMAGKEMDLVIVRENTEGFYADRNMFSGNGEFMPTEDVVLAFRKITVKGCRRIAKAAFEIARKRRQKVTAVHKANVMRVSDGLFLREVRKVAQEYPEVKLDEKIVDAMAALLVRDPAMFDVIVTTNMFGDILSDEASEISGSLGLAGSLNAGDGVAMGQPQHGSAPDIAGKGIANPVSLMLSASMLLDWMSTEHKQPRLADAAKCIADAVELALSNPATRTRDLGGTLGTQAFTDVVLQAVRK